MQGRAALNRTKCERLTGVYVALFFLHGANCQQGALRPGADRAHLCGRRAHRDRRAVDGVLEGLNAGRVATRDSCVRRLHALRCGALGPRHDIFLIVILLVRKRGQENSGGYPAIALVTTGFLFRRLQTGFPQNFFEDFARRAGSCCIKFARVGFRASPPSLENSIEVRFLYITYVTASTRGTYPTKIKPGSVHGANLRP